MFIFFIISPPPRALNSFTLLDTNQNRSKSVNQLSLEADQIYISGDELGSKFSYAPIWGGGAEVWETLNFPPFSSHLIENQKLYHISRNQAPKSIRMRDIRISLFFDPKNVLFLPYLSSKFGSEIEIWYVHLVGTIDVSFEDFDFSAPFQPLPAPRKWFLGRIFSFLSFLEFVPRVIPLQIELGSWNLVWILSKSPRYAF